MLIKLKTNKVEFLKVLYLSVWNLGANREAQASTEVAQDTNDLRFAIEDHIYNSVIIKESINNAY